MASVRNSCSLRHLAASARQVATFHPPACVTVAADSQSSDVPHRPAVLLLFLSPLFLVESG